MKYIDIHGHINFLDYDADREEVIKRAHDAGVGIVIVGTDLVSSKRCVELAEKHGDMWAVIGMHPTEASGMTNSKAVEEENGLCDFENKHQSFDIEAFRSLAKHPKVVAIGECGLDYFHLMPETEVRLKDIAYQKEVFIQHIEVANYVGKPLMLHVRNADVKKVEKNSVGEHLYVNDVDIGDSFQTPTTMNAYQEALRILMGHSRVPANFHFFAGTMQDMNDALAIGCSVSFTGVITFTHDYDELIKSVPLDRIMTETDCPFVTPKPYRGKRNEPAYVVEVVKRIAEIRALALGESAEMVAKQLLLNAVKFYGLEK